MSRRLKQMEDVRSGSGWNEYFCVFKGVKEPGVDHANIHIPLPALGWYRCWLYVFINGKGDWKETHVVKTLNKKTYTYRRPDIPAGANIQIIMERHEPS